MLEFHYTELYMLFKPRNLLGKMIERNNSILCNYKGNALTKVHLDTFIHNCNSCKLAQKVYSNMAIKNVPD